MSSSVCIYIIAPRGEGEEKAKANTRTKRRANEPATAEIVRSGDKRKKEERKGKERVTEFYEFSVGQEGSVDPLGIVRDKGTTWNDL